MKHMSAIVNALEDAWLRLREEYPAIPPASIVVGRGKGKKRGHWHAGQWEGPAPDEVCITGERLSEGARAVMATLVHEAVHGYCHAEGIQETSRKGQYHNGRFAAVAEDFGLLVGKVPGDNRGHNTDGGLSDESQLKYAVEIAAIDAALQGTGLKQQVTGQRNVTRRVNWKKAVTAAMEYMELGDDERAFSELQAAIIKDEQLKQERRSV